MLDAAVVGVGHANQAERMWTAAGVYVGRVIASERCSVGVGTRGYVNSESGSVSGEALYADARFDCAPYAKVDHGRIGADFTNTEETHC